MAEARMSGAAASRRKTRPWTLDVACLVIERLSSW